MPAAWTTTSGSASRAVPRRLWAAGLPWSWKSRARWWPTGRLSSPPPPRRRGASTLTSSSPTWWPCSFGESPESSAAAARRSPRSASGSCARASQTPRGGCRRRGRSPARPRARCGGGRHCASASPRSRPRGRGCPTPWGSSMRATSTTSARSVQSPLTRSCAMPASTCRRARWPLPWSAGRTPPLRCRPRSRFRSTAATGAPTPTPAATPGSSPSRATPCFSSCPVSGRRREAASSPPRTATASCRMRPSCSCLRAASRLSNSTAATKASRTAASLCMQRRGTSSAPA
mmetsp:Transcript_23981/g.69357  ORF Transcript_23981/g.69357 Transcript_23981/m.69357 type:complete len:289 (+) Transcript_23981:1176-2042(+)